MRLSLLQRFILKNISESRSQAVNRAVFSEFYKTRGVTPADMANIITNSLERLIDRGLLVGHGIRTPKKWFIREVRLTPLGKKSARALLGTQQTLKLK